MEQIAMSSFFSALPFKPGNVCQTILLPENQRTPKQYVSLLCKHYHSRFCRASGKKTCQLSWKVYTGTVNEDFSVEESFSRIIVSSATHGYTHRCQVPAINELVNSFHQQKKTQTHYECFDEISENLPSRTASNVTQSSATSNGSQRSEIGESLLSSSVASNAIQNPETDGYLPSSASYDSHHISFVLTRSNGRPVLEFNQNSVSNIESKGSQSHRSVSSEPKPSQEAKPRRTRKYARPQGKQITVALDALKPGTVLPGKVTNIQPYGAFVDVGGFTSGLIHISNLSRRAFVKSVEDVVTVGQEVKVEVLLVNVDLKRVNLRLVTDEGSMPDQVEENVDKSVSTTESVSSFESRSLRGKKPEGNDKAVSASQRISSFENRFVLKNKQEGSGDATPKPQKGEIIQGQVTKIVASGVYVALKNGQEGFLPASEVLHGLGGVDTGSYFRKGHEIPIRVTRTTKDRIFLSMRKEKKGQKDVKNAHFLLKNDEGDRATSPFEIAFRQNKIIATYLEQRDKAEIDTKNELC